MALPAYHHTLAPAAFLDWEARQDTKHEYHRGETFAMAGGTEAHARIITNLVVLLGNALRGKGCTVYTDALRVRVETEDLFTYPDLSVVCGEGEFYDSRRTTLLNPLVLVEVLSPSTEAYDRMVKRRFYGQIPSLQAYVLVSQDAPSVDVLTPEGDGWHLQAEDAEGRVRLGPLGLDLALDEVYEGVAFPERGELDRPSP